MIRELLRALTCIFSLVFDNEIFHFRVLFDSHESFSILKTTRSHPVVLDKVGERSE